MTKPQPELATVLPRALAEKLRDAASQPAGFERSKAIDQVTQQIKFSHPQYFKDRS